MVTRLHNKVLRGKPGVKTPPAKEQDAADQRSDSEGGNLRKSVDMSAELQQHGELVKLDAMWAATREGQSGIKQPTAQHVCSH